MVAPMTTREIRPFPAQRPFKNELTTIDPPYSAITYWCEGDSRH